MEYPHNAKEETRQRFHRICGHLGVKSSDVLHVLLNRWIDSTKEGLLWKLVLKERKVQELMPPKKKVLSPSKAEQEAADIDLGDEELDLDSDGGEDMDDLVIDDIDLDELEGAVTTEALEKAYGTEKKSAGGVSSEEINVLSKRIAELSLQLSTVADILTKHVTNELNRSSAQVLTELEETRKMIRLMAQAEPPTKPAPAKEVKAEEPSKSGKSASSNLTKEQMGHVDSMLTRASGKNYPLNKFADAVSRKFELNQADVEAYLVAKKVVKEGILTV